MYTKRFLFSIIAICITLFSCKHDNLYGDVPEQLPQTLIRVAEPVAPNMGGYFVGLPARYELNSHNVRYPTIVCFPGAGAYGDSTQKLDAVLAYGIPKLVDQKRMPASFKVNGKEYSFIVLAPQFIEQPLNMQVKAFIEYAKQNYRIDTTRLYLVGVSVGGRMACDYAARFPYEVASLISMGGNSDNDVEQKAQSIDSSRLPVWLFHNEADRVWPIGSQRNYYAALNNNNPIILPRLTVFEIPQGNENHDSWTRPTNPNYKEDGKNIYEWMLQYTR